MTLNGQIKRLLQFSVAALVWATVTVSTQAQTALWSVEKNGRTLYLGGTMHLLSPADFPLPPEYNLAYSKAEKVYFEADVRQMETPATQLMVMNAMTYQDGRTLQGVLKPDTYAALEKYLRTRGMPIAALNQFTAGGMSLTVSMLEMQALGLTESGVDEHFLTKAVQEGKAVGFLETLESQMGFIAKLGEGVEDELIVYTLADVKRMPMLVGEMVSQWRSGDLAGLEQGLIDEMRESFPDAYESLLLKRNRNWLPQIESMMGTAEVELVLVGAAHLAGDEGLIEQLALKGYQVKQL